MPDSTISPLLLRDTGWRTNEQGAGAPRRTPPGTAAATGSVRANGSGQNPAVRPERVELRWRDLQWVDFSSELEIEPDPTAGQPLAPEPEPVTLPPMPEPDMALVEPATTPPPLGNLLRRFAEPALATQGAKKSKPIPGLAPRFTRVPVPRRVPDAIRLPLGRRGPIRLRPQAPATAAAETRSLAARPRIPDPAKAAPAPPARRLVGPKTAHAARPFLPTEAAPTKRDRPFPGSISTPVSAKPEPRTPWPGGSLRHAVAAGVTAAGSTLRQGSATARAAGNTLRQASAAAGSTLRQASAAATAAGTSRLARARAMIPRPGRRERSAPTRPLFTAALLSGAAGKVSRFAAARGSRARLSGVALGVVLVGLGAYLGGMVIARVTQPSASPTPPPASAAAAPAKQPATADNASRPAPPISSAATAPPSAAPSGQPPADPAARAAFYIARAKAGDAVAQFNLGVLYAQGQGLVQDYTSAASWFRAAAAQGNVAAEYNLGVLYAQGLGVTANPTEAINWYQSAADQHHPAAQFNLGFAYATGTGTKQDFAAAARWYKRAAVQGLAPAMANLAILYEAGTGVERSPVDAYAWYSAAGEHGDAAGKARAKELFQQFDDKDKARAEGLAATIGAALDSSTGTSPPAT